MATDGNGPDSSEGLVTATEETLRELILSLPGEQIKNIVKLLKIMEAYGCDCRTIEIALRSRKSRNSAVAKYDTQHRAEKNKKSAESMRALRALRKAQKQEKVSANADFT